MIQQFLSYEYIQQKSHVCVHGKNIYNYVPIALFAKSEINKNV